MKTDPKTPRFNETELACYLGITEDAVREAEKRGAIHREADGLFDAEGARRDWLANRRRQPGPGRPRGNREMTVPAAKNGRDLYDEQTRHERVKIAERKLKLRRAKEAVIDKKVAERRFTELCRGMSERILNWPPDAAGRLATKYGIDVAAFEIDLEVEMRTLLGGMTAGSLTTGTARERAA